ncbi:MAG: zf-HC2 domain-containing protein, partial [Lachnospiraceae bacterium]|nr:zf-HC2 domain-containing protein [Lachnospiraceae bacterium]
MKNEICILVKDLLPSYIDGVCSEDSIKIIENHINECEECKAMYESMKSDFTDDDLFAKNGGAVSEEHSEFGTNGNMGNSAVGKDFDERTSAYEKSGKVNSDYKYRERNIGNGSDDYDRELLKKVNEKIKKRENKF